MKEIFLKGSGAIFLQDLFIGCSGPVLEHDSIINKEEQFFCLFFKAVIFEIHTLKLGLISSIERWCFNVSAFTSFHNAFHFCYHFNWSKQ